MYQGGIQAPNVSPWPMNVWCLKPDCGGRMVITAETGALVPVQRNNLAALVRIVALYRSLWPTEKKEHGI